MGRYFLFGMVAMAAGCTSSPVAVTVIEKNTPELTYKHRGLITGPRKVIREWPGRDGAHKRDQWIRSNLEGLRARGWESIQERMISVGKASVAIMVNEYLDDKRPAYRTRHATFSVGVYSPDEGLSMGAVVQDMLVHIITYFSNYAGDSGTLPQRDAAAWRAWYAEHGSGLKIGYKIKE